MIEIAALRASVTRLEQHIVEQQRSAHEEVRAVIADPGSNNMHSKREREIWRQLQKVLPPLLYCEVLTEFLLQDVGLLGKSPAIVQPWFHFLIWRWYRPIGSYLSLI